MAQWRCIVLALVLLAASTVATDRFVSSNDGDDVTGTGDQATPFASIRKALSVALDGDTIRLADGLYTGMDNIGVNLDAKDLDIVGESRENTILSCGSLYGPAFDISFGSPLLSAMTIRDCYSPSDSGAVTVSGISVSASFADMLIKNCSSGSVGGAMQIELANVTFTDVTMDGNAAINGGTLFIISSSQVVLDGVTLANSQGENGGAIYMAASNLLMRNSHVVNCSSLGAGALYLSLSTVNIYSTEFLYNSAQLDGTCVFTVQVQLVMHDCSFRYNQNVQSGSAVLITASNLVGGVQDKVANCEFIGNNAGDHAALYVKNGGSVLVTNSTFRANIALAGPAISASTSGIATVNNCTMRDNIATPNDPLVTIASPVTLSGGAICVAKSGAVVTIVDVVFTNNTAQYGGAIFVINGGVVTVSGTKTVIAGNHAWFMGGGLFVSDKKSKLTVSNAYNMTIADNTATYGGGIAAGALATLTLKNVIFRNNFASAKGSGVFVVDTVAMTNAYFDNNRAGALNGGVVNYNVPASAHTCPTCVVLANNQDNVNTGPAVASAIFSSPSQLDVTAHSSNLNFASGGNGSVANPYVSMVALVPGDAIGLSIAIVDALGNALPVVGSSYRLTATFDPSNGGALLGYAPVPFTAGGASSSLAFVGKFATSFLLTIQVTDASASLIPTIAPLVFQFNTTADCGQGAVEHVATINPLVHYPICVDAELSTVDDGAFIAVQIVTAMLAAATLGCLAFIRRNRSHWTLRSSSPLLLQFMLGASTLVFAGVFIMGVDSGSDSNSLASLSPTAARVCRTIPWLLGLGFDLIYGAMLAKAWRIHKIFNDRTRRRLLLSDAQMLKCIVIFAFHDIILNAVWVGVNPLDLEYKDFETKQSLVTFTTDCTSEHFGIFTAVYLGIKGAALLYGVYLAVMCRHVANQFNESKQLGFAIYNLTFVSCIIIPLVLALDATATAIYLIAALGTLFALVVTLAIIFVPKVMRIVANKEETKPTSSKLTQALRVNVQEANAEQWTQIASFVSRLTSAAVHHSSRDFNDIFESLAAILMHLSHSLSYETHNKHSVFQSKVREEPNKSSSERKEGASNTSSSVEQKE
ncbi:hypothetical protein CAOG_08242 [Capsaspora owczarzaki ATCC 30864]|nr:hypothetical protein CAOG_08242 [Capsaspora owczarzaki ATCC 30864]|eukprot:XP_004342411.2 hypothetical protein CAOG_08242 [Capsaspora owczarzaki ATCC 30864]